MLGFTYFIENAINKYARKVVTITTYTSASQVKVLNDDQFTFVNALDVNGIMKINPKKKVHFITVNGLYLSINGFTITR